MSAYDTNIENYNYAADPRNCDRAPERVTVYIDEEERELPTKWVICGVCDGEGTVVNPAIDAGGLGYRLREEDPDFYEDYHAGVYDIACKRCGGSGKVRGVDWNRVSPEEREAYERALEDERLARAEYLAEIRAGA